ncbi:unnamed protein product [Haemonchus placei]|uniref:G protein-coupled receptor n=1 Tax=Haemonchus placei TaxID=6290 RepID=A0A0N4WHH9_HAEPC|nr:unnamed protein product [Haemonchus placei]
MLGEVISQAVKRLLMVDPRPKHAALLVGAQFVWALPKNTLPIALTPGSWAVDAQPWPALSESSSAMFEIINNSHRWILPVLQWVIPGCFSVPLVAVTHAVFLSPENLEVMADQANITLATSMAVVFVSVTFIECALCYGAILRFLMRNRLDNSTAIKRERRLYLQMLGLFVAFVLVFVYNIMGFLFSLYTNEGPILTLRAVFPVLTCFFSYVNVWMTLILNDDIRRKIWALLGYHGEKNQSAVKASSSHKVFRLTDPTPSK